MKLHLPTALFALAVLPAVAFAEEDTYFFAGDYETSYHNITPDDLQGAINIVVPVIESSVDWLDGHPGKGDDSSCRYKDAVVHPISERVAKIVIPDTSTGEAGTLVLKNGDTISAGNDSKVLYVDGNVSLESGAKVTQTGNSAGGLGQMFKPGMIAKNVSVSEGASMELDAARFDSLTVTGGTVTLRGTKAAHGGGSLHGSGSETSDFGISGAFEFSNAHIAGDLNVQGGTVTIGRDTAASSLNRVSYISSTYYQGVIGGTIKQSGGTLYIKGMTYLNDGQIEQTGGTMQIAKQTNTYAAYLRVGSDTMTVNQAGDASTVLNLNGIIVNGSTGQGNMQLLINQSGEGTINMSTLENRVEVNKETTAKGYKGSYFTTASKETASVIKQSGSGTININSDYTSATFNVEQTGKGGNITIGANGKLQSNALTLTDASTFTIASSKNGGLTLNEGAEVTFTVSSLVSTYTGNTGGLVVEDGKNFIAKEIVSVKVVFSDDVVMSALTELTSAEGQVLGTREGVLIATGDVSKALTFSAGTYEKEYDLGNGTTATVEFAYEFENEGNQVFANVTATVTGTGTTPAVPEPATATLSLLALAGLCARRRRK